MEEKPWFDQSKSDADRLYEESVIRIKNAVKQSMSFEQAVKLIDVADEGMRRAIADDALKVLIAEMHFAGGVAIGDLARRLKLPEAVIERARGEMIKDVEAAAIDAFKSSSGAAGNA